MSGLCVLRVCQSVVCLTRSKEKTKAAHGLMVRLARQYAAFQDYERSSLLTTSPSVCVCVWPRESGGVCVWASERVCVITHYLSHTGTQHKPLKHYDWNELHF